MKIEKKTWPEYFEKVLKGEKNFDLRISDFEIEAGDTLVLKEWDPTANEYTGRVVEKEVTLLIRTKDAEECGMYKKEDVDNYGYVVMGF